MVMRTKLLVFFALSAVLMPLMAHASDEHPSNRIKIEYIEPEKAEHKPVYELMKNRQVLEKIQQLFSPVRLPIDLSVKSKTCGMVNAWYQRQDRDAVVTICYEYVADIFTKVPEGVTPAGITHNDAIVGQFIYTAAHETGHALFDLLDVPLFGRAEDAADQFSAYIMLQMGPRDARRLITGAAYSYKHIVEKPEMTIKMQMFSDVHGSSAQRFYNLVCMAYGANPQVFGDVVKRGFLPEQRSKNCIFEYRELAYAFKRLIRPHVDQELAKKVLNTNWLPPEGVPIRLQ
jgi:hypothetical protein